MWVQMLMKPLIFAAFLIISLSHITAAKTDFFPDDGFVSGWKGSPIEEYRTVEELFLYMNGGAELYLEYKYAGLKVREYSSAEGGNLTVEIYTYINPADAFGIFSVDTTGIKVDIGDGGRQSGMMTRFWKGNYYVRVFNWVSKPEYEGVPEAAARAIEPKIPSNRSYPQYLTSLWESELSFSFVRGEIALRQVAGAYDPESVVFDRKDGAAWIFPDGDFSLGSLVLSYRTSERLNREFVSLWDRLSSAAASFAQAGNCGIVNKADGSIGGIEKFTDGAIFALILVPHASDEANCLKTMNRIKKALNHTEE